MRNSCVVSLYCFTRPSTLMDFRSVGVNSSVKSGNTSVVPVGPACDVRLGVRAALRSCSICCSRCSCRCFSLSSALHSEVDIFWTVFVVCVLVWIEGCVVVWLCVCDEL
eukprot:c12176_g1_i5.p1 GENE.c12176_g1_i5~~c12176_g1_i5.p1  ORF type:complete len:109 (-),score=22.58 c12176_g1_i5:83-409(-)